MLSPGATGAAMLSPGTLLSPGATGAATVLPPGTLLSPGVAGAATVLPPGTLLSPGVAGTAVTQLSQGSSSSQGSGLSGAVACGRRGSAIARAAMTPANMPNR